MLGRNSYPKSYVEECRAKLAAQGRAYEALRAAVSKQAAAPLERALATFESHFFNHMVLALDAYFVHRVRNLEGKNGNALNETRLLANSLMTADGVMTTEKVIKYEPESSLLGYAPGDRIALDATDFERLAGAFLKEIEARYS